MVHALTETHRVLAGRGVLLDLRPDKDPAGRRAKQLEVHVIRGGTQVEAGYLDETAQFYPDYLAADQAIERIQRAGLFRLDARETFRCRFYLRDLPVLDDFLRTCWLGTTCKAPTRKTLERTLARLPGAQIRVTEIFQLNVLRK